VSGMRLGDDRSVKFDFGSSLSLARKKQGTGRRERNPGNLCCRKL